MASSEEGFHFINPPTYPEDGAYGQLLWWHLFVWGTHPQGDTNKSSPEWSLKKFAHAVHEGTGIDDDTAVDNLNNWIYGKFKPRLKERRERIENLLFDDKQVFQRWRLDLRESLKRPKWWDFEAFQAYVGYGKSANPALTVQPPLLHHFNDIEVPFAHHQLHKSKAEPNSLIELLRTDVRATSLVGRGEELAMLGAWLSEPQGIAVKCIIGGAGAGKTRLAIEVCERAEADGWFATFLPSSELRPPHDMQALANWIPTKPTLLVVDYAATSVSAIKHWFGALALQRDRLGQKLRILLLERHADPEGGWWADLLRPDSLSHASAADLTATETPYILPSLDALRDRRALLTEVMAKAAPLFNPLRMPQEPPKPGDDPWFDQRLTGNRFDTEPLYLIMAGIRAVEIGVPAALVMNKLDLARRIAEIEEERLRKFAIARGFKDEGELLTHIAACVTIQNGCFPSELPALVKDERLALDMAAPFDDRKVARMLCDFLSMAEKVAPVRPDLIGEIFCLPIIKGDGFRSISGQCDIILRCWQRDPAGTGETLIRCAGDLAEGSSEHLSLTYLRAIAEQVPDREPLTGLYDAIPLDTLALREFAANLSLRIVSLLREAVLATPDAFTPDLAMALNNLAIRLSALGQREAALAAIEEAVALYRQLVATRPDAFTPDLAGALNNLAIRLSALGQREAALAAIEEAVALRRQLVATRPDAFTPNLALVLNNLANSLSDLGRREAALAAIEEAVALGRQLFATRPDVFGPDLAGALNTLANRLSALGQREAALAAIEEAVALYRQLVATRPDAFAPDLARSLSAHGEMLENNDCLCDAVARDYEAVAVLAPYFFAVPEIFGQAMRVYVSDYMRLASVAAIEIDEELIGRIRHIFS